jgi:hypothetical protein
MAMHSQEVSVVRPQGWTLIIVVILLMQFSLVYAATDFQKTGTFSSLFYHKEAGDLLGFEIRIVFTRNGYQGTFQAAEGGPDELILIKGITIEDNKIKFLIPGPSIYEGEFSGHITNKGIKGTLILRNGNKIILDLKRQQSYWDGRETIK